MKHKHSVHFSGHSPKALIDNLAFADDIKSLRIVYGDAEFERHHGKIRKLYEDGVNLSLTILIA